jgi:hypothetical protein
MDSAKLNDWLQVAGTFGVIASLLFVGLEMRQAREIAVSQAYQSRAESEVASALDAAGNSMFLSGEAKIYAGRAEDLSPEEEIALEYQFGALLTLWENDHFQYERGFLSEEHWEKTVKNMTCTFGSPFKRELLSYGWHIRDSFQAVLERIVEDAESDPLGCWDSS